MEQDANKMTNQQRILVLLLGMMSAYGLFISVSKLQDGQFALAVIWAVPSVLCLLLITLILLYELGILTEHHVESIGRGAARTWNASTRSVFQTMFYVQLLVFTMSIFFNMVGLGQVAYFGMLTLSIGGLPNLGFAALILVRFRRDRRAQAASGTMGKPNLSIAAWGQAKWGFAAAGITIAAIAMLAAGI